MVSQGTVVQSAYDPWALQDRVGLTDARMALDSLLMPRPDLSYIDYRSGVMVSGDSEGVGGSTHMGCRVQPGTGLSVTVEMGHVVINTPGQGAYMCPLDSVKTLDLSPASTTTNRIDLVIARVYDDLNSAIGSPADERKFTIEVWQGDASSGTPTEPVPPISAGWHPLAAVRVDANAGSLSLADITDRRGPGLVARGGMRALYGADAQIGSTEFSAPGAYPGDQRWVQGNSFQHQVYYGSGGYPTGWRGVFNCLQYDAQAPPGEWYYVSGEGTRREICRVTVPYPGVPFKVYPSGHGSGYQSPNSNVTLYTTLHSPNGSPEISWNGQTTGNVGYESEMYFQCAPMMTGPFFESVDVVLSWRYNSPTGGHIRYRGYGTSELGKPGNYLSVLVFPATVQP